MIPLERCPARICPDLPGDLDCLTVNEPSTYTGPNEQWWRPLR